MNTPFTIEEFLGVFVAYNSAIWPAQIFAYILGFVAVATLWIERPLSSRLILAILSLMWAWNGVGYHFLFFSTINSAAKIFAGFFVLQSLLLAYCAVAPSDVTIRTRRDFRSFAGCACILYAMLLYPLLGIRAGHGLMAGPMFGVAPCPTTIFTIGLLLLARGRWVVWLSVIPFLWSVVGLAAALQLGIPEDFGLPVAGLVLVGTLVIEAFRARRERNLATNLSKLADQ